MKYWTRHYMVQQNNINYNTNSSNNHSTQQPIIATTKSKTNGTPENNFRLQEYDESIKIPLHLLVVCNCCAGALASWITSPLDMAKLRLQVQRGALAAAAQTVSATGITTELQYRGMIHCLYSTYQNEGGVRGLFRGAGARVLHFTPATTITMTLYETFRTYFSSRI